MAGNKPGKPTSKRVPVRLRNKIQKASSAKQKKARRAAKANPEWRSRVKKDPGIPNLFPYKERILAEIEEGRRRKADDAARRKEGGRAAARGAQLEVEVEREGDVHARMEEEGGGDVDVVGDEEMQGVEGGDGDGDGDDEVANPMAALLASARAAAAEYNDEEIDSGGSDMDEDDYPSASDSDSDSDSVSVSPPDGIDTSHDPSSPKGSSRRKDSSRKAFDKVFKRVVDQADVVLYVLDARDPEGTRSKEVERMVMAAASGGKRLILILNKIDLIPPPVLQAWLVHLRRSFPTLPLRAAGPAPNAHTFNHKSLTVQGTAATLFQALKSFAAAKQLKRAVSCGVIGYPNVGKSSVINALTSRVGGIGAACPVGAEAGVTTSLREVKIDSKLKLLDSPGIVFPSSASSSSSSSSTVDSSSSSSSSSKRAAQIEDQARLVLLNAIPPKQIADPIPAVTLLLKRLSASQDMLAKLMDVYGLPPLVATHGDPTTDFLVQVARKRGRLGKGGVPNLASAATTVLTDWRDGRIQGWMDAPLLQVEGQGAVTQAGGLAPDQKLIVKEWAEEFKLEGLWGDDGGGSASTSASTGASASAGVGKDNAAVETMLE